MATNSSVLSWEIPWIQEPGGPQSVGSQRVRQDSCNTIHTHTFLPLMLSAHCPDDDLVTVVEIKARAPEMNQGSVHLWGNLMFGLFLLCSDLLWQEVHRGVPSVMTF